MRELKGNWKDILASFKLAFDPAKVLLAFIGFALTIAGILIIKALASWAGALIIMGVVLGFIIISLLCFKEKGDKSRLYIWLGGTLVLIIIGIIFYVTKRLYDAVPYFAGGFWLLVIWSFFGGAIARIAAVEIATDERVGFKEALRFAARKYQALIWSPLVPLLGMLFLAFLIVIAGLLCAIPGVGPIVFALIFFPLMLIAGFAIFLIAIGGVLGFELMFPAIAAEASDAFDAISRAYSYIFSQPWRWILYNAIAVVYAGLCMLLVKIFAKAIVIITAGCASVGWGRFAGIFKNVQFYLDKLFSIINNVTAIPLNWYDQLDAQHGWIVLGDIADFWQTSAVIELFNVGKVNLGVAESIGVFWISLFLWLFVCFAASYVISLAGSLQTLIYFLMRKHVDGTELDEVNMEETESVESELFDEEKEGEKAEEEKTEKTVEKKVPSPEEMIEKRKKDLPPINIDEEEEKPSGESKKGKKPE